MSSPTDDQMRRLRDKYRNAPSGLIDQPVEQGSQLVDAPNPHGPAARAASAAKWVPDPRSQPWPGNGYPPNMPMQRPAAPTAEAARSERIGGRTEGAQRGWRSRVNRFLHTNLSKGSDEIEYDRRVSQIQRTLRASKTIAVLSGKGSSGKTSIALNMGATIASKQRGMKVVAMSIDPMGNLTDRVRAVNDQAPASVMALAAESDEELKRTSVVSTYLQTDRSGLRVLGSSTCDGSSFLTPEGLDRALGVIADQYNLNIVDFGLNIDSPSYHAGLRAADQLVLAASTTADSIDELHVLIRTLRAFGGKYVELLAGAVVAFSQTRPGNTHIDIAAERNKITNSYGMPVITLPFDEHVSEGGPMSIDLMDEDTRLRYVWLAAEVMNRLPSD